MLLALLILTTSSIDAKAVKYTIGKAQPKVHACYDPERAKNKELHGTVKVRWTIEESGQTTDVTVVESSLKNANVEECLVGVVEKLKFGPHKGGPVVIAYPFTFDPTDT